MRQLNKTYSASAQVKNEKNSEQAEKKQVDTTRMFNQTILFSAKSPYCFCISLYRTGKKASAGGSHFVSLERTSKRFQHTVIYIWQRNRQKKTKPEMKKESKPKNFFRAIYTTTKYYIINCIMFENICFCFI